MLFVNILGKQYYPPDLEMPTLNEDYMITSSLQSTGVPP